MDGKKGYESCTVHPNMEVKTPICRLTIEAQHAGEQRQNNKL